MNERPSSMVAKRAGPSHQRWLLSVAGGVILMVGGALCWSLSNSPSTSPTLQHELAQERNALPKLIAQWKDRADTLERAGLVDSRPLLADPKYASSAELAELLKARTSGDRPSPAKQLEALGDDLTAMAALHHRLAEKLERAQQMQGNPSNSGAAGSRFQREQHELEDQASRLLTLAHRFRSLKDSFDSPQGSYDAGATVEIAVLRDMEAAVDADEKPTIAAKTLPRAEALAASKNQTLAWMAVNTLARSDDAQRAQIAIKWLPTYTPVRQAQICWSLLVSGQQQSIAKAISHLQKHPELLADMPRSPLLKLVGQDPSKYQAMLPLLADSSTTAEDRLQIFECEVQVANSASTPGILKACASGLLRNHVDQVVLKIVQEHRRPAYALAERLLDEHRDLTFPALLPEELETLQRDAPQLAGKLAVQLLLRGSDAQRTAAFATYCDPQLKETAAYLQSALDAGPAVDRTDLLNLSIAASAPKGCELAETLLRGDRGLDPKRINYSAASEALLDRAAARDALVKLAWQLPQRGRAWALKQLLGVEFIEAFDEANATSRTQIKLLEPVIRVLDGKMVPLKNVGMSSGKDRGLQIGAREIPRLPTNIDPALWASDSAADVRLKDLRKRLETVQKSTDSLYGDAFGEINRYLDDLVALNTTAFEIANIYDFVITKQRGGVEREMRLKKIDSWDFRFPASLQQTFGRDHAQYRDLVKSLESKRESLVLTQPPPAS
jgi:hypothetical protein